MTLLLTAALSRLSLRGLSSLRISAIAAFSSPAQEAIATSLSGKVFTQRLTLNQIADNPGAKKRERRVGRGVGSSKGKTCGRGHKGQKSRSGGGVKPGFEGGQTPFWKTLPKRGMKNPNAMPMLPMNVGTIQDYIDMGRLDPTKQITIKSMVEAGMAKVNGIKHGIKLLANGKDRLKSPLNILVSRASTSAIEAVEGVGGQVMTVHYNKLALRALLRPHKFDVIPRQARPPPRLMEYYTDWNKRGYLSPQAQMRTLLEQKKQQESGSVDPS